jgi:catechol 2,3-dioxygenase-like lactoylglutathione lyase family enzyme
MIERPIAWAMLAATDPQECLRFYARMGREMAERAGPLIAVVFVQGAGRDPDVRAFVDKIKGAQKAVSAPVVRCMSQRLPNLCDQFTGRPRQVPLTWAVTGAYSIVHIIGAGVSRPGSPPTAASDRQALTFLGWAPPAGSHRNFTAAA